MALALLQVTLGSYVATTALYLGYVIDLRDRTALWARRALLLSFVLHLAANVAWVADLGPTRLAGTFGALPLATWLLVAAYLLLDWRVPLRLLGAFVTPVVSLALLTCCLVHPSVRPVGEQLQGILRPIHISLAFLAATALALASGVSALYLLLERQLKAKRLSPRLRRLPSLETLDRINYRCVTIGFPVYTAALIVGGVWAARLLVIGWRPQYTLAVIGWVAIGALLQARLMAGWRGRRAAVLTLAGSAAVLLVVLHYVARGVGAS